MRGLNPFCTHTHTLILEALLDSINYTTYLYDGKTQTGNMGKERGETCSKAPQLDSGMLRLRGMHCNHSATSALLNQCFTI